MIAYYILMGLLCSASVLASIFQQPTGEGFVRGYNVMFTFLFGTLAIWTLALVLAIRLAFLWIREKELSAAIRKNKGVLIWIIVGILVPVLNIAIIRIKSAIEYGRF